MTSNGGHTQPSPADNSARRLNHPVEEQTMAEDTRPEEEESDSDSFDSESDSEDDENEDKVYRETAAGEFSRRPYTQNATLWSAEPHPSLTGRPPTGQQPTGQTPTSQSPRHQALRINSLRAALRQLASARNVTPYVPVVIRKEVMTNAARQRLGASGSHAAEAGNQRPSIPQPSALALASLVSEVKGIYAGLVMIESKCVEVDSYQPEGPEKAEPFNDQQWQALVALHRTLLHEHHDFFLASQHPSATPAMVGLAQKYAMPARMWRHAVHSFLEVLRQQLPASFEHMLNFLYNAYAMLGLLLEAVPMFRSTWVECLGDLGRYRMAIEMEDAKERDSWAEVSRSWYRLAVSWNPDCGRLYHHLAILARPDAVQQFGYYSKALCSHKPYTQAYASIMSLLGPLLETKGANPNRLPQAATAFARVNGILLIRRFEDQFDEWYDVYLKSIGPYSSDPENRWIERGPSVAITNWCSLMGYNEKENLLAQIIRNEKVADMVDPSQMPERAVDLNYKTHWVMLSRFKDPKCMPYIHVMLVFVYHIATCCPGALRLIEKSMPWKLLATVLNTIVALDKVPCELWQGTKFPVPEKDTLRPLSEDVTMRGLLWSAKYFPKDLFPSRDAPIDQEIIEVASMQQERIGRVLFLAHKIARRGGNGNWLRFNPNLEEQRDSDDSDSDDSHSDDSHSDDSDDSDDSDKSNGEVDPFASIGPFWVSKTYDRYYAEELSFDQDKVDAAFRQV